MIDFTCPKDLGRTSTPLVVILNVLSGDNKGPVDK